MFTYNGTTYAPLRALAEDYGLEAGYDGSKNLATVNSSKEQTAAPSSDFNAMWTIAEKPVTNYGGEIIYTATYNGNQSMDDFKAWWKSYTADERASAAEHPTESAKPKSRLHRHNVLLFRAV